MWSARVNATEKSSAKEGRPGYFRGLAELSSAVED